MNRKETDNFTHEIFNDPKIFKKDSFRTVQIDDKSSVVYGVREADNKEIIHKLLLRKK